MPFITVKAMESVLSKDQKRELCEQITDTFASIVGEPARAVTWVVIEEVESGAWTMAGNPITTEAVKEMLAAPAAA